MMNKINFSTVYSTDHPVLYSYVEKLGLYRYVVEYRMTELREYETLVCSSNFRLSKELLRKSIEEYYNTIVKDKILNWNYKELEIYLSNENQQNYITAYTLGLDYLKVKGGTDSEPKYLELTSKEEIAEFVKAMQVYIQECVAWGWEKKDSVDYSVYGFIEHSNN